MSAPADEVGNAGALSEINPTSTAVATLRNSRHREHRNRGIVNAETAAS